MPTTYRRNATRQLFVQVMATFPIIVYFRLSYSDEKYETNDRIRAGIYFKIMFLLCEMANQYSRQIWISIFT